MPAKRLKQTDNDLFEHFAEHWIREVEGDLSDNKWDDGGLTKYGISKRAYPNLDIAALTWPQAKTIYKLDFWGALKAWRLPPAVAVVVTDNAIMSGMYRAVCNLQRALTDGITVDGLLGSATVRHVADQTDTIPKQEQLLLSLIYRRLEHMRNLMDWPIAGKGWTFRMLKLYYFACNTMTFYGTKPLGETTTVV